MHISWIVFGDPSWKDYELKLEARKTGGTEGFLVLFEHGDVTTSPELRAAVELAATEPAAAQAHLERWLGGRTEFIKA